MSLFPSAVPPLLPRLLQLLLLVASASLASANYTCPAPGLPAFDCPGIFPAPPAPKDVRHLSPSHISAIMALGDSITAGFAMQDLPLEYRGSVYSAGGDPNALTIGNFLSNYNAKIEGRSTGTTIPLTKLGKGLNFAVSEARVRDVPGQIQRLAEKLNTTEYRHLYDEWKLLVLFIGANDICECKSMTAQQFQAELTDVMVQLHQTFPKTFVATMTIFNISQVWDVHSDRAYCDAAMPILHECSCLTDDQLLRTKMDILGKQINDVTKNVSQTFADLNDPNFTVSVQPAVENVPLDTFPKSVVEDLLSDLDCFHPSLCTDGGMAIGVWNNLFQAPGTKATSLNPLHPPNIYCPTKDDILM